MEDLNSWRQSIIDAYATEGAAGAIGAALCRHKQPKAAVLTSFGTESAVLLKMVAEVAPDAAVIFLETGKHFQETIDYANTVKRSLGLRDVRFVKPNVEDVRAHDRSGGLWQRNPDRCCFLRKVVPLRAALGSFSGYVSGRKRFQSATRSQLSLIETADDKVQINPLFEWDQDRIEDAMAYWGLPPHPLQKVGYRSIGCKPCTMAPLCADSPREGRWPGLEKTECGIHESYFQQLVKHQQG